MLNEKIEAAIEALIPELTKLRRDLHMHPELGMQEFRTTQVVKDYLAAHGVEAEYLDKEKKIGLQYLLDTGKEGNTILLRGDMGALPILEEVEVPFKSQTPGVMHACGHDLNTVFVTGAAAALKQNQELLKGKVKFIWQCSEETLEGAKMAIKNGALDGIEPKYCFGFHGYSDNMAGKIGIRAGNCLGASDNVHITVKGAGGHAAAPHQTIDPVMITGHVLTAIQSVVARYHKPWDPIVITIGMIHGGTALNITPAEVKLTGTMRTFDKELRNQMPAILERTLKGVARGFGGDCDVQIDQLCPAVVVTDDCFNAANEALKGGLGAEHVVYPDYPCMGSEDFAFFCQEYPGMQIQVGTANEDPNTQGPFHTCNIDFDEKSIYWGVKAGCALALGIC